MIEHGLGGARLRPLAKAAGASDRMLIYHFGDKQTLVTDLLEYIAGVYSSALDMAIGSERPATRQECFARILALGRGPQMQPFMTLWWEIVAGSARGIPGYAEAAEAMISDLAARLPDWRCLVNSASVFDYDDAVRLDPATAASAMQINALSPARMAQAFLRGATSQTTRAVVQITDMKLANPNPDFFSYTMSKHAHAATIALLAQHYAQDESARVYGLAPGALQASHDQREDETDVSHRLNLLGRKTGPDEIVEAARFLATGALKSGSTLYIDSGQHLLDQPRDVIYLARALEEEKAQGGV